MSHVIVRTLSNFFKKNWKIIFVLLALILFIGVAQRLGLDKKAIVIIVLFFGYVTQLFAILVGLIALIPIIGPPVASVISLPFFLIVNAIAYIVTLFSLRKGYTKDVLGSRILVTTLLVGIIIGYALGKLL
ncbi:MAG: hypothetical protein JSV84_10640 [Gemmatimonadota bacterium]|nr:MAG: hypothetical protein JSV84_10640 [Gemmatimonadota bacterium]